MTLIAASIPVDRSDEVTSALARATAARDSGADLLEWRIDRLAEESGAVAAARRLVANSPLPCIVTCRPSWEGGGYGGDDGPRAELLAAVLAADPPRYVDVELEAYRSDPAFRRRIDETLGDTTLILSTHDFEGRPPDLLQRVEAAASYARCGVIKVAWQARSLRDNLEAFELLASRPKPMIALCMGPFGLPSRVLAGKFGALLTFASENDGPGTAPGQPSLDELMQRYHFRRIGAATAVYGVIGWPVAHSRSPVLHNAGFAEIGHDGVYLPLPVAPGYEPLKATLGAFLDAGVGLRGASVTLPHKTDLLRFVRESGGRVDDWSGLAGAANTLLVDAEGGVACANTDAAGLLVALDTIDLEDTAAAVLGAGGVARTAAAVLAWVGADVTVFNRTPEHAEQLAAELDGVRCGDAARLRDGGFAVIANCTSVGMEGGPAPRENALELIAGGPVALDDTVTVLDTVYTPRETPLVVAARAAGANVITGDRLFIEQAALQFQAWTGKPLPTGRTC